MTFTLSLSAQDFQEGIWLTENGKAKIETYQNDGVWYGKVISSDNPKVKSGTDILKDIKQVDGEWKGKFFVAKRNRLVDAVFGPTKDKLKITIFRGSSSKTLVWKRHNDE
jgi:hypothetical protein